MIKQLIYGKRYENYSTEKLVEENLKRARYFAIIIFALEACFLLASFVLKDLFSLENLTYYRLHYFVLLSGSGLFYLVFYYLYKKKAYGLKGQILLYVALFFAIAWGASLSLLDVKGQFGITVYLTFVFISSFAILSRPDISALIMITIQIVFCFLMPDTAQKFSYQINSSVFVLFAWFAGRYQYELINERFLRDDLIEEKNRVLENQNNELARLMMTDHLTDIYNRYSLDDILAKKWMESYIHQTPITCFMIDIDDFKKLNDMYGHVQGDRCLKEVSKILKDVCDREEGYAFRYGGDEFCLLFSNAEYPEQITNEIYYLVDRLTFKIDKKDIGLKLSIGMFHEIPKSSDGQWMCIEGADKSLYQKKSSRKRRATD
ncbi:GGDEF domain-containing protein [Acidaminobacter sp. JC074]|uniref:GGDEF domain-containing protein n=1 Tax=Acidaminobacter sp. JC074 TaxID=2530199 RepID=UPI001F10536E|nr:GGDEF domain-containing protein [Acidaminobacter sp. JC074]MCH4886101.1 GGDEF domain-containing protein [Acidaminobacter sp. JC074]